MNELQVADAIAALVYGAKSAAAHTIQRWRFAGL